MVKNTKSMISSSTISFKRIVRGLATSSFIFVVALSLRTRFKTDVWREEEVGSFLSSAQDVPNNMGKEQRVILARKNLSPSRSRIVKKKVIPVDRKGKERILVEKQRNGKNIFHIEGLPQSELKEVRNFLSLTAPSAEVKEKLAPDIKKVYDRRRQRLVESCKGQGNYHWNDSMQLIAAPNKDLTVCVVQKAGSSNWHRVVYDLRVPDGNWTGDCHATNRNHGIALQHEVKHNLMTSKQGTRVLTVRHPFARIISGWNNKFHKNHLLKSTRILTASSGIENYIGIHEPDDDHIIAFEDFVQYLVETGVKKIDPHFKSIEELCSPCDFPYDYIAKAETTTQNLWYVLDRVGATMPTFAKRVASGSGAIDIDRKTDPWEAEKKVLSAFFGKVPLDTVKRLMKMYEADFLRFGYGFDVETLWAGDVVD